MPVPMLLPQVCPHCLLLFGRAGPELRLCIVQVPEFDVSNLLPELALSVRKASKDSVIFTNVAIVAKHVLDKGGIGRKWPY